MVSVFPMNLVRNYAFLILSFTGNLVRPPGFEPGTLAWKAKIMPGLTTAADHQTYALRLKRFSTSKRNQELDGKVLRVQVLGDIHDLDTVDLIGGLEASLLDVLPQNFKVLLLGCVRALVD